MNNPHPSKSQPPRRPTKLVLKGFGGNLALASVVTLSLIGGMVLVLALALTFIVGNTTPSTGLAIAIAITLAFNLLSFFLSPFLMDLTQRWLYQTRWVSPADIQRHSPAALRILQQVCTQKKLKQPRLGIIDDDNPTAFTYGSFPNSARLVVSRGLFKYLDDDEIAAVYAHELGHIVHWDFAVMTLASTLVQVCYLVYVYARSLRRGSEKVKDAAQTIAIVAYIFYFVGSYLLLYLSRIREYFADRFAAEVTRNPNALSRALVKIAYGIVEEGQRAAEPSRMLEGTRALGIYDHKSAGSAGTAYRIAASGENIGRVFLWDMFNPWGWWMELSSTHPLTGKRVRALSTYAEQLGMPSEFDFSSIVREGKRLSKQRLYSGFALDLVLFNAATIGLVLGLVLGLSFASGPGILAFGLWGFGIGTSIKTLVAYPKYEGAPQTDVLTLMSDPYASPLRGQPARLDGELIGRGDAGNRVGSDLKLQDRSGLMFLRYSSRFGSIGNFFFGLRRVQNLIGQPVKSIGWFRRGIAPWMDLIQLESESGTVVNSYHRFWSLVLGGGAIALGIVLIAL